MINNKIDAIVHLLMGQNIIIIRELFNISYFTGEMFMISLRKSILQYRAQFQPSFILEIIDLIDEYLDINILEQPILNYLISNIYVGSDSKIFSNCFARLTNLGAIVNDDYSFFGNYSTDVFFNYVSKNKMKINKNAVINAVCRYGWPERDENISDWIVEQWESQELEYDQESIYEIVSAALFGNTYFARIMQKIYDNVNIEIIVIHVVAKCQYIDDIDKIIIYATECVNYDKLQMLKIIKYFWSSDEKNRFRYLDVNMYANERKKIQQLIKNTTTLNLYHSIIINFENYSIWSYDTLMTNLGLFADIYHA